jgi:2-amino-4-hydroxy-6-hydroxymethyldihydropteridine diphosphokinase
MTNGVRPIEPMIEVYLGLGSNLGDREANLAEALERIKALGLEIRSKSSLYETEPVGHTDQPCFLNQVIGTSVVDLPSSQYGPVVADPEITVTVQAEAFLSELLEIERNVGRERLIADGPRVIDIDLLLFGDKIIEHSKDDPARPFLGGTDVFVPHPRMHLRRFVLEPLCEIAPEIVHPVLKKTCREMLALLDDDSWVRRYKPRD